MGNKVINDNASFDGKKIVYLNNVYKELFNKTTMISVR